MDRQETVSRILKNVDIKHVPSRYTTWMIEANNHSFVNFLSKVLDTETIDNWDDDPNNHEILEKIADNGWCFYNHTYIGNSGYEWVSNYA